MQRFIQQYGPRITGTLSGFDRLRFRGTLRLLAHTAGMQKFLNHTGVLLKQFKTYVQGVTDQVRAATEALVRAAGLRVEHLPSARTSKEERARHLAEKNHIREGLICVFSAVEPCFSYEVHRSRERQRLELTGRQQKCLHYYFYLQHREFGFMYLRLQTWFPLTIHIGLNGREWLARQLNAEGIGYRRADNCFLELDDLARAQALCQQQLKHRWRNSFLQLLHQYHPTHRELFRDNPLEYYWSLEQSEWATDVLFRSPEDLAEFYPQWLRHAAYDFGSAEVMRFLGRKVTVLGRPRANFTGEVVSDVAPRADHLRIKHRINENWLKMYDKQGTVLRIETTLNNTRDMKVFRHAEGERRGKKKWRILRKSVADIQRRAQICQAANERYLDSLAQVHADQPLGELMASLCRPAKLNTQRVRALQPWSPDDARLLEAIARPQFQLTGFRNRDLRALLFGPAEVSAAEQRRQAAKVSRLLRLLRGHGLIRRVPTTFRYQLTAHGRTILAALQAARTATAAQLAKLAG
jgi:hypothetical protein